MGCYSIIKCRKCTQCYFPHTISC